MKARVRSLLAWTAAAGLAALAIWRMGLLGTESTADRLYAAVDEGRRAYANIRVETMESLRASDEIGALVARIEVERDSDVNDAQVTALRSELESFLRLRFVQPDAKQYAASRLTGGCRWTALEGLERGWRVVSDYEKLIREPPPAKPEVAALFERYWDSTASRFGGANRLVSIASEPVGLAAHVGYSRDRDYPRLLIAGQLGQRLWYGPVSASMCRWFDLPHEPTEVVAKNGRVLVAEVGVVAEWADGSRRPLILAWYFDPWVRRWILWQMNENNYDRRTVTVAPLEY